MLAYHCIALTFSQFQRSKVSYAVSIVGMKSVKERHKSASSKTKRRLSESEYSIENIAPLGFWLFKPLLFPTRTMYPFVGKRVR